MVAHVSGESDFPDTYLGLLTFRSRGGRFRNDGHAVLNFLQSFRYHPLAWFQPLVNDPQIARSFPHLHRTDLYLVIRSHHGNLMASLQLRYRALGDQQRSLLHPCNGPHSPELSRAKQIVRVGKTRSDANGSCFHVDLSVRKETPTGAGTSLSLRVEVLNLFNQVHWAAPASSAFGNSNFGLITNQANNMRMVQFTARFQF